jgi:hypothetical protein
MVSGWLCQCAVAGVSDPSLCRDELQLPANAARRKSPEHQDIEDFICRFFCYYEKDQAKVAL